MTEPDVMIQTLPIDAIKPYHNNPRDNADAVAAVATSLYTFGILQPIVVDQDNVIIAGDTRFRAIRGIVSGEIPPPPDVDQDTLHRIDPEKIPVIIAKNLSPERVKQYRVIDNKTGEKARWNWDKLQAELRGFIDDGLWAQHFPELELKPIDVSIDPVSQEEIDGAQQEAETHFHDVTESNEARYKTIVCPHCGQDFEAAL